MDKYLSAIKELAQKNEKTIVLVVFDGLGDISRPDFPSALERANKPNLDRLAKEGLCGLAYPVAPGITPGSGPGHLGLFGYDPLDYQFGRGILEALGAGMDVGPNDIAIRGNFITVDKDGIIIDRRAGRIPDEEGKRLVEKLKSEIKKIEDVEILISHVKEYRFAVIFRGEGLGDKVNDTDPQKEGLKTLEPVGEDKESQKTAYIAKEFIKRASEILKEEPKANGLVLRGFAKKPAIPPMQEVFKLNPSAIAVYPMYKGIAKLVGMDVIKFEGQTIEDEAKAFKSVYGKYDFYFIHVKKTDSYGEDGNIEKKVEVIEEADRVLIPTVIEMNPDVIVVTADHSTPAPLKSHSWHPVPVLLWSKTERVDSCQKFTEKEIMEKGGLKIFYLKELMPIALACAQKLKKYGA